MSQVIRIADVLYNRLAAYAEGFETPSNVMEKILDAYEGKTSSLKGDIGTDVVPEVEPSDVLQIKYIPDSEGEFKQQLLKLKKAYIKIYYTNGTTEIKEWNASKFSKSSKLDGNLRSGYLRGWKKRGIYKAELSVDRNQLI